MIAPNDIVKLPVKEDSLKAGLDYALISWTSTFNRMGKPNPYKRIEKILLGVAAENEFIDYLKAKNIKYELKGRTRWYEADRYDIGINGTPVYIKANFLDLSSAHIQSKYDSLFQSKEEWFLKCHALVPLDQFNCASERKIKKNYLFPFIEGYFTEGAMVGPLVHAFWDYTWLKKGPYKDDHSTEHLIIGYSTPDENASIKIYGTSAKNEACIEEIKLNKKHVISTNSFHQVFSIVWTGATLPQGKLTIRKDESKVKEIITNTCEFELVQTADGYAPSVNSWQSLKLYQYSIYLLGWIKENDFRVIGDEYPRFSHNIEQYGDTKVDNWGCLVSELEPVSSISSS